MIFLGFWKDKRERERAKKRWRERGGDREDQTRIPREKECWNEKEVGFFFIMGRWWSRSAVWGR